MPRFSPLSRLAHAAGLACLLATGAAQAQAPLCGGRPVTVVVPFAAGGGVDATARLVVPKVAEGLKQSLVIENVAGAAGTIGTQRVARAAPDGFTLLFAVASPLNVAPLVAPAAVRYDSFKDFTPLSTVAVGPFVLVGKPGLPANTAADLVKLVRSQPGKLNFGTDGVGTSLHVTAELLKQRAGLDMVHVPYKSGPQVLTDVAGGQVDLAVLPLTLAQPFIRDGKVRAYGVTSAARWPGLPEVPALVTP
jgi:tripartite-type tricarboxylate transporter receptor subunit TctC